MKLVIDISASDKTRAAVVSVTDPTPLTASSLPQLVLGDSEPLDIKFTDGSLTTPAAPSWAGDSSYTLVVGLGTLDANAQLCYTSTTSFTTQTGGWLGRLPLTTTSLIAAVNMATRVGSGWQNVATDPRSRNRLPAWCQLWLQIQVIDPSGQPTSYAQLLVPLVNRLLPANAGTVTDPNTAAYAWLLRSVVLNRSEITALTGGGATSLDGLDDSNLPTGCTILLSYSNVSQLWRLVASTATTDVAATPARVRAAGYSSNNRVWYQVG